MYDNSIENIWVGRSDASPSRRKDRVCGFRENLELLTKAQETLLRNFYVKDRDGARKVSTC